MKRIIALILVISGFSLMAFSLGLNGGYEFQTTLTPSPTPTMSIDKNNLYLNLVGNGEHSESVSISLSLSDKIYLNFFDAQVYLNGIKFLWFAREKRGSTDDWLGLISAEKLGDNYAGLSIHFPWSTFFYGTPDFSDTTTKYKTLYYHQRLNYGDLFTSLLYCTRSSDLRTTYEDLYSMDFTYKMGSGYFKGEGGLVESNENRSMDLLDRIFFMLGYQNGDEHITYTQFARHSSYSISSYQPMMKADFKLLNLSGWYYKSLKIGGKYQPKVVDDKIQFSYYNPDADTVNLAGNFNGWSKTANPMKNDGSGLWTITLSLSPETYQYKFVVNGSEWVEDPCEFDRTDDGFGGYNSVIIIIETSDGIAISMPKDKFYLGYSSDILGALSFASNLRDEVNGKGNYLYKVNYSKDFKTFGFSSYIGYPEDNTSIASPDSYELLLYLKGDLKGLNYEIGYKPICYTPNFTDTFGYLYTGYNSLKINVYAYTDSTWKAFIENSLPFFDYGSLYFKAITTNFKDFNFYSNLKLSCLSPAEVDLSIGDSDFDKYNEFQNKFGLYVKTTF